MADSTEKVEDEEPPRKRQRPLEETKTKGMYVPPFKMAAMRAEILAKSATSTKEYQRVAWDRLRKGINGLVNKVNTGNLREVVVELFEKNNLVRGRGVLARALMKAQLASPGFTHVYAAVVAALNTKLPQNGELILKRLIVGFRRAYKRRDKVVAIAFAKFLAHLVNHQVAHEIIALQLLTVLLDEPTDDSVSIAVEFSKDVGQTLQQLSPQGFLAVFERFRGILHEGKDIDKRVQYTVENLFTVRKNNFHDYPAVPEACDVVDRSEQITFEIAFDDTGIEKEEMLDIFQYDPDFDAHEQAWQGIKKQILGQDESSDDDDDDDSEEEREVVEDVGMPTEEKKTQTIDDMTEQDLVNLRRTIYLTIMSAVGFEECAHKLMKLDIPKQAEIEVCKMIIECCSQERTYLRYYGLLGQRFCVMTPNWRLAFDGCFREQFSMIHRLETNKLRNVAKFFAHLLSTDALPWTCLDMIKLNEDETTSSSRIFVKILTQELAERLGIAVLKARLQDQYMADVFKGMFPMDLNVRDTRFAINFFTSIGLGALTDQLRIHLKKAPKLIADQLAKEAKKDDSSSSSSSSSDSDSSSSSSSGSSSSSSGSSSGSSSDSSDSDSDSDSDSSSSSGSSSSSSSSNGD